MRTQINSSYAGSAEQVLFQYLAAKLHSSGERNGRVGATRIPTPLVFASTSPRTLTEKVRKLFHYPTLLSLTAAEMARWQRHGFECDRVPFISLFFAGSSEMTQTHYNSIIIVSTLKLKNVCVYLIFDQLSTDSKLNP